MAIKRSADNKDNGDKRKGNEGRAARVSNRDDALGKVVTSRKVVESRANNAGAARGNKVHKETGVAEKAEAVRGRVPRMNDSVDWHRRLQFRIAGTITRIERS